MKITFIIFNLLFIALGHLGSAQVPPCQWAQRAGGSFYDQSNSVSTDASGNVYITGNFQSPSIVFGTTTLTNAGGSDIFIVKYSPAGTVLWANSAYGGSGNGVCTDASGNVFVTGHFTLPSIAFGTNILTNASPGNPDVFIVKYSSTGTVLWAKGASGSSFDQSSSVSTDANGNVIITGRFYSPSIAFGTSTLTNAGGCNIFIVKYSSTGTVLWANSAGGTGSSQGTGVSTDSNGNIFMTGNFDGPSIVFGTGTLTNAGVNDVFIVKYSPVGTVLWSKNAGGTGDDYGNGVSTDASGNVFMTGRFYSPSITFGTTILTNAGSGNIFIVKYSPAGTALWANSAVGNYDDCGNSVSTDASGNVFMTGRFGSPSIAFGTSTLTNPGPPGNFSIFITKYAPGGTVLWANSLGGIGWNEGTGVSTDAFGNVFMTGYFDKAAIIVGTNTLTNANFQYYDIFIAKLGDAIIGLDENQLSQTGFTVYPNPFSSQTTISFSEEQASTSIRIRDILGKEVLMLPHLVGTEAVIERGNLQAGIYFVQVVDEKNNVKSRKLVVQ